MPDFTPTLVMSVHGIRTYAEWQLTLSETLGDAGIQFKHRRFGYYPVTSFLRAARNQAQVDAFRTWYDGALRASPQVNLDDPFKRPSLIAHSFGTFIVAYAMLKYPEIKLDKLILCGCILPTDFDWHTLFVRDQLGRVRNECGGQDVWVKMARYAVKGAGDAGRAGFRAIGTKCSDTFYDYQRHSDFFSEGHIKSTWLPFLKLSPSTLRILHGGDIDDFDVFQRHIHRVRAVDRVRFGRDPVHERVALPFRYSEKWRSVNPDIYTFVIDRTTSKACGYINAMPLEDWAFKEVTGGRLRDNQIPGEAVRPYLPDSSMKLYFMSIAIAPRSSRAGDGLYSEPVESLLDAFFGRLRMYARKQRIRITEVAAIGWTAEGTRMCERLFGMHRIGDLTVEGVKDHVSDGTVVSHAIYHVNLERSDLATASLHRGLRELLQLYEEMK